MLTSSKTPLPAIPCVPNVTKQVDHLLVTYGKHPAFQALDLLPQVGILLGKLVGSVPGLSLADLTDPNQDLSVYGPALTTVFQEIHEMDRGPFILGVLRYTKVEALNLSGTYIDSLSKLDVYFGENILTLLKVLLGAMKHTYGNFIDADSIKRLVKVAPESAPQKESL